MARLRRRAELLVWLNPRAAQSEFQPLAGSMAAALPYCDVFLPAHSLSGLYDLFLALASGRGGGASSSVKPSKGSRSRPTVSG